MAFKFFRKKEKKEKEQPKSAKGGSTSSKKEKVEKPKAVTETAKITADTVEAVESAKSAAVASEQGSASGGEQAQESVASKGNQAQSFSASTRYIVRPHVTEKATVLAEGGEYIFVVSQDATKHEVQKSVHQIYGVDVERVRIITVHPKKMRMGRIKGVKKGYKKAIVKIKEGQSLDILPR